MIEAGRYCVDILTQMRAVHAALREIERDILRVHLETCVQRAFVRGTAEDREQKIAEVLSVFDWERGRPARPTSRERAARRRAAARKEHDS
jgi:DNA-binding FrmR family transcriptional regulator